MADLTCLCAGIRSPNPFWLASGPATDSADQVLRAFDAGWGGAVWKTVTDPPTSNVCSRYNRHSIGQAKLAGLSNIELISDRPLEDNLKEIRYVKKVRSDRALIVSIMMPYEKKAWQDLARKAQDTGCDGLELNLSCPHGLDDRWMGSMIGQIPDYVKAVVSDVKAVARIPVLVKLTPNVADIRPMAQAALDGGADGLSLINTVNSLMGIDTDTLRPRFAVDGKITHGGYSGHAIKPIALHMVSSVTSQPSLSKTPVSGIGGISSWQDAAEFFLLGCSSVQVCTAVMLNGFGLISDLASGLSQWMDQKGFATMADLVGKSASHVTGWQNLNLHYKTVAHVDEAKCTGCGWCVVSCRDAARQCIDIGVTGDGRGVARVKEEDCIGCNLCAVVCPEAGCVEMIDRTTESPYRWNDRKTDHGKGYTRVYKSRPLSPKILQ
ncbi:MAG TPA: NAD-dependent dihydropyrimidine dehydrogenase subunit PreA [Elusimicrobiota bacterium]|nr:NAD-dependent dihydropyrimidine dehydrogenase subunit PreA [Elusimicrobiota bacterium]